MFISVIIPTLNEKGNINKILTFLTQHHAQDQFEIIVVDGGSTDGTITQIEQFGAVTLLSTAVASRAHQMNEGAKASVGEVLYFVHADIQLLDSFVKDISQSIDAGDSCGCYRFTFADIRNPLLYINGFFTRFPFKWCRGGDQTFYITKKCFKELGGFNEHFVIMEDYDILDRLKIPLKIIPKSVKVSSRKYKKNSYFKVQLTNMKAMKMYNRGESPEIIKEYYIKALK